MFRVRSAQNSGDIHKVLDKIGEGGMGKAYLAKDTKPDREVAVKVLPAGFSENNKRLALENTFTVLSQE